jgi:hypothetical protein
MYQKLSKALAAVLTMVLIGSSVPALAAPAGDSSFMKATESEDVGIRNNYAGYSGYRFTAETDITVTALGRADVIKDYPMKENHDVVIWDVEKNEIIAKVTVTPSSPMENGYRHEKLSQSVKLLEGKQYSLVSAETKGGDYWLNSHDLTKRHTKVASGLKAITGSDVLDNENQPDWMPDDDNKSAYESQGFVGLNFWYEGDETTETTAGSTGDKPEDVVMGNGSLMTSSVPKDVGVRNNYGGYSGIRFTAVSDITVTTLGRSDVIGDYPMKEDHDVVIWDVEKNEIIAKVTVTPSSPMENGYRYENLSKTVTLLEGKEYSLVSAETMNGDYWPESHDMTGRHTNLVTGLKAITGSGYLDTENQPDWMPDDCNNPNYQSQGFVGLNFWYVGEANVVTEPSETTAPSTPGTPKTNANINSSSKADGGDKQDGGVNPLVIVGICVGGIVIAGGVFFAVLFIGRGKQGKQEAGGSAQGNEGSGDSGEKPDDSNQ